MSKQAWDIKQVRWSLGYDSEIPKYLLAGWEPFQVDEDTVWFRKLRPYEKVKSRWSEQLDELGESDTPL